VSWICTDLEYFVKRLVLGCIAESLGNGYKILLWHKFMKKTKLKKFTQHE